MVTAELRFKYSAAFSAAVPRSGKRKLQAFLRDRIRQLEGILSIYRWVDDHAGWQDDEVPNVIPLRWRAALPLPPARGYVFIFVDVPPQ